MSYIIVWRSGHKQPFLDVGPDDFIETYSTYEKAKEEAERIQEQEGPKSPWYFDYRIFKEADE